MLSNTHFSMAIHVLVALAYNDGRVVSSDDLARTVGTNPSFLRGLIGELREAGLVETRLGKGGGALLARRPAKIRLDEVYRATEDRPAVTTHVCDGRSPCPVARNMEELLGGISARLEQVVVVELKKITLAGLLKKYIPRKK